MAVPSSVVTMPENDTQNSASAARLFKYDAPVVPLQQGAVWRINGVFKLVHVIDLSRMMQLVDDTSRDAATLMDQRVSTITRHYLEQAAEGINRVELDEYGNVLELKLADFGLACEVTEPLYAVCGTPTYVAPEILLEVGYGLKIDVWAAGIILYILLCGFPPFVAPDNQQEPLFDAIISGVYEFPDPYWSDIGDGVRDLIANMLQSDPAVRFTSEDILDHYWTMNNENSCFFSR
ncbi:uncharacterized protein Dana_GF22731 [Drosophila ananassae]|uniref:Protein kinase domain-containing protein n=1 Tax=Drosophila ananassae TaxID=7217 RepID=A0A0P9BVU2_DROAN|nr:uncharacterized protein Dana_GF22731 [Drosophila ananassae]